MIEKIVFFGGSTMNKRELIAAAAEKAGVSKKDAEAVVKAALAEPGISFRLIKIGRAHV